MHPSLLILARITKKQYLIFAAANVAAGPQAAHVRITGLGPYNGLAHEGTACVIKTRGSNITETMDVAKLVDVDGFRLHPEPNDGAFSFDVTLQGDSTLTLLIYIQNGPNLQEELQDPYPSDGVSNPTVIIL